MRMREGRLSVPSVMKSRLSFRVSIRHGRKSNIIQGRVEGWKKKKLMSEGVHHKWTSIYDVQIGCTRNHLRERLVYTACA